MFHFCTFHSYTATIFKVILILVISIISTDHNAQSQTAVYNFQAPKSTNPVDISVDSLFEMNKGTSAIISGNLCFDPPTLDISCGKIIIPSSAIIMSNKVKTAMLHSKKWLNKKDFPNIIFEFDSVEKTIRSSERIKDLLIRGTLTIKGNAEQALVPVKIICEAGFSQINNTDEKAPELSVVSSFSISRSAFKIKPDLPSYLVDDTIFLDIHIYGVKTDEKKKTAEN